MRTVVALLLLAAGCGGSEEERPEGTSDTDAAPELYEATAERLWAPDHVVEIAFEVEVADGEALAAETNDLFQLLYGADCVDNPWAGPFNWYPADVTVDGVRVEQVGIRKKGLIGSLSTDKPSLKIKFDKYVEGQQLDELLQWIGHARTLPATGSSLDRAAAPAPGRRPQRSPRAAPGPWRRSAPAGSRRPPAGRWLARARWRSHRRRTCP